MGGDRSSQINEGVTSNINTKNGSNGFGDSSIKPTRKVDGRFTKVRLLSRDVGIQIKTE